MVGLLLGDAKRASESMYRKTSALGKADMTHYTIITPSPQRHSKPRKKHPPPCSKKYSGKPSSSPKPNGKQTNSFPVGCSNTSPHKRYTETWDRNSVILPSPHSEQEPLTCSLPPTLPPEESILRTLTSSCSLRRLGRPIPTYTDPEGPVG